MTTREQIIAAAKEAGFPEWENTDDPEFLKVIEKLYVVAFQSGAASRDAEVAQWQKIIDEEAKDSALVIIERDQLRAELAAEQANNARLRDFIASAQVSSGVCCCGEAMDGHSSPMSCGHSPVDMWDHAVEKLLHAPSDTPTPEQSLAEYRNKVIEAFVNEFSRHVGGDGEFWLHELQDFAP